MPLIHGARHLSIFRLQEEISRLAQMAQTRMLALSDIRGDTFTITNYGAFGGRYGMPMILPPQVAILGTSRIRQMPVVRKGTVVPAYVLMLSLVVDHRLIDRAYASRFLARFMELVQKPLLLLAR